MTTDEKPPFPVTSQDILAMALTQAEEKGWDNIRLYQIAEALNAPLEDIHHHYPDLNGVADAWFNQALSVMFDPEDDMFAKQPAWHRLYITLEKWFDHLSKHHQVTAQIICSKMHPPHVHHWGPMIFDLSRLIHWWLDAAHIAVTGRKRQIAEIGLTVIFLRTLTRWINDQTPQQRRTRDFLKRHLKRIDQAITCFVPLQRQ